MGESGEGQYRVESGEEGREACKGIVQTPEESPLCVSRPVPGHTDQAVP